MKQAQRFNFPPRELAERVFSTCATTPASSPKSSCRQHMSSRHHAFDQFRVPVARENALFFLAGQGYRSGPELCPIRVPHQFPFIQPPLESAWSTEIAPQTAVRARLAGNV